MAVSEEAKENVVEKDEDDNAALLAKLLANPETAALIKALMWLMLSQRQYDNIESAEHQNAAIHFEKAPSPNELDKPQNGKAKDKYDRDQSQSIRYRVESPMHTDRFVHSLVQRRKAHR